MRAVLLPRAAAIVSLALAAVGCTHDGGRPERAGAAPAATVSVVRAGATPGVALVLPARVTAHEEVTLTARLAGRLTALPLREGDRFARGGTLAVFDEPETRAALESARARLASATLARDLARREEVRIDSLYAAEVVTQRERERAEAERKAAEAAWAEADAQLAELRSGITLSAPFAGVVVRRRVDPGATVGPGQPVLDIRSEDPGEIAAAVPESELDRLGPSTADYQIGEGPWRAAALVRVDGMTDFTSRSRVARFRPLAGPRLEPGAFARVRLAAAPAARAAGAAPVSLSVPARAVVRRGQLAGVYVVEDGEARLRWLRIGREDGGAVEVLAGLVAADLVVADPSGLTDGRAVKVTP